MGNNTVYQLNDTDDNVNESSKDFIIENEYPNDEYNNSEYRNYEILYYKGFQFEIPVYLYVWPILVIMATLANILVTLVLLKKSMRNSTNVILVAIAISDSLTGMVTIPIYMYAYQKDEHGDLPLTKQWCEAFMMVKYFMLRALHTVSIWLTVVLGLQRFVSVSFPFRAQSIFTIRNTIIMIAAVTVLSPCVHIYHFFNNKVSDDGICEWRRDSSCGSTCVYLWLTIIVMHFIPCFLLVIFTGLMVILLKEAEKKIKTLQMVANKNNLKRRHEESRRITLVVIAIVVVFLMPEIPYGIFLMITAILAHSNKDFMPLSTNRALICGYEILLIFSFHANFWIYFFINKRFRHGFQRSFDPIVSFLNTVLEKVGIKQKLPRRPSITSCGELPNSDNLSNHVNSHPSSNRNEMKVYRFNDHRSSNDSRRPSNCVYS